MVDHIAVCEPQRKSTLAWATDLTHFNASSTPKMRRMSVIFAPGSGRSAIRTLTLAFAAISGLMAIACEGKVAAPPPPKAEVEVEVSTTVDHVEVKYDSEGWPGVECAVYYFVSATGKGKADWIDVTLRWYGGVDRTIVRDSIVFLASELQDALVSDEIAANTGRVWGWLFSAGYPFEVEASFRYRPENNEEKVTTARTVCGLQPPAGGISAPTIESMNIGWGGGALEPSDTIQIDYRAHAATGGGLWMTFAGFGGAFEDDTKHGTPLDTVADRQFRWGVPKTATVGEMVNAGILVVDAFMQTATQSRNLAVVSDETPPSIWVQGDPVAPRSYVRAGPYFVGDRVSFYLSVRDNHRLSKIWWEATTGERDSLTLSTARVDVAAALGVQNDWVNGTEIRVKVQDVTGHVSPELTATVPAGTVLYPAVQRPSASAFIGGNPLAAAIDESNGLVYVVHAFENDAKLITYSLDSMKVVHTTTLISKPIKSADVTTGGDSVVLLNSLERSVVLMTFGASPSTKTIVLSDSIGPLSSGSLVMASNGKVLVGDVYSGRPVVEVDLATGSSRPRRNSADSLYVDQIVRSHDRSKVLIVRGGCGQVYDAVTDSLGKCKPRQHEGAPMADFSGNRFIIGLDVYDGTFTYLRTMQKAREGDVSTPALSPDGEFVHFFNTSTPMARARVSDGAIVDASRLSASTWPRRVWMSPSGSHLLVYDENTGFPRLMVVDMRSASATTATPATSEWVVQSSSMSLKKSSMQAPVFAPKAPSLRGRVRAIDREAIGEHRNPE